MDMHRLDLNLLVALEALLSERSVTRAAVRLGVSQPKMSAALQKLQTHYSDPLLERERDQLRLTPLAKQMKEPLKKVLTRIQEIAIVDA